MPITLDGTLGITTPSYGGADAAEYLVPVTAFKNRIINGAMVISQRNGTSSVTPDNSYTLDRWVVENSQSAKFTVQQNAGSVTPPVGFRNYLGITSTSAYSVISSDYFMLEQRIEGFNIADLDFGTANAKTVTLSFWVRSSLTGTFGGSLMNGGNSRAYPFTYTISSANTWEQKSITVAGDTSGTWTTTNSIGMFVNFGLGMGSSYAGTAGAWTTGNLFSATGAVSVVGTNGATFYITGVQLEVGTNATFFDARPYGTELALCQRYFTVVNTPIQYMAGHVFSTNRVISAAFYPTTMRATPTLTTSGRYVYFSNGAAAFSTASATTANASGVISIDFTVTATANTNGAVALEQPIQLSAEL